MRKKILPVPVLIIVAALLVSGCTTTGNPVGGGSTDTSTAAGTDSTVSPSPIEPAKQSNITTAPGITSGATDSDPTCGDTSQWGTGEQGEAARGSPAIEEIYDVAAGQHSSCDRVRFDINTPDKVDWTVKYVPELLAEGSGEPIPISGSAILQVTIQAPDFASAGTGHQPWRTPWKVGSVVIQRDGWQTFSKVVYAGSFEHVTIFGIVLADMADQQRRPFHVWDRQNGSTRQIVVDIAH